MKQTLFKEDGYAITVNRNEETDKQIVDMIVNIFKNNRCSCPESVADDEDLQCEGAEIFSEFAEILELGSDEDEEE